MRDRWDEQHGEQTYSQMTIAKALPALTGQYRPRNSSKSGAANPARPRLLLASTPWVLRHRPRTILMGLATVAWLALLN
jgi:hypothetical protein